MMRKELKQKKKSVPHKKKSSIRKHRIKHNVINSPHIENLSPHSGALEKAIEVNNPDAINQQRISNEKMNISKPDYVQCSTQSTFNTQSLCKPSTSNTVTPSKRSSGMISYVRAMTEEEIEDAYNSNAFEYQNNNSLVENRKPYFNTLKLLEPKMRAILLDWMMGVCYEKGLKRSTYHLAVVLVDVFLSKIDNISPNQLQLVGVTCLDIANKNEETAILTMEFFSKTTMYAFSANEIVKYEQSVLAILHWKIQYTTTLAFWGNLITRKWDSFGDSSTVRFRSQGQKISFPKFRKQGTEEYFLFRDFFQIIDEISLDYEHFKFEGRLISAAVLYILMGLSFKIFNFDQVTRVFAFDFRGCSEAFEFNPIFNRFLITELDVELDAILEEIQYVSIFFNISLDYQEPVVRISNGEALENVKVSYEDYLQIQTYNSSNIKSYESIIAMRREIVFINQQKNEMVLKIQK